MERSPVKSSNVKSVGYDPSTKTMEVEFKSGVYQYDGVLPEHHEALMKAESIGAHMGKHIRGKYETRRMPEVKKA